MEDKELLIILKRIKACLKHEDWINAKEYINIEIERIKIGGDIDDL